MSDLLHILEWDIFLGQPGITSIYTNLILGIALNLGTEQLISRILLLILNAIIILRRQILAVWRINCQKKTVLTISNKIQYTIEKFGAQ